ncbi:MAG TPA: motility protein A, partial [Clostridiaceae bacterium]|nr:motility protein A [Clostridiaceae bacterium]HBF76298.1 motility protein A [Clostridiaceae bacterium]HBG39040.1 motility protein A [Clostridiaceae bacterium]HBN27663.1 motility protein A [Clostridiaceae bacterium]
MKKRDLSTTIGLICGVAAILISMMWGQDDPIQAMKAYYDTPSIFITVVGSFMSIVICFPPETLKRVPAALHNAFISKEVPANELISQ